MVQPSSWGQTDSRGDAEGPDSGLRMGDVFELLQNPVRRYVLYELHFSADAVVSVESLAEAVSRTADGDFDRERVEIALEHEHLPKLSERDLVEYDRPSGKLWYRSRHALTEWLEHAAYKELPRSHPLLAAHESRFD